MSDATKEKNMVPGTAVGPDFPVCACGHPKSHHYFDPAVRTGPWKCLTFFDLSCRCGVYRERK